MVVENNRKALYLFAGLFNKEYSIKDKLKFGFGGINASKKKNQLITWLEL